tara:strand:- start:446 stop:1051 length:606 start_codon:yes stop_codon:yes gene_type:complete
MAKREYKTAGGKSIDFDTLALKGEETIAVGNMGVNARGDKLGTGGGVVKTREEVMADYYRIHNGTIPQDKEIPDPDDIPQPVNQLNVTADAAPIIETNEEVITSNELAQALAETAVEVKEDPALKSAASEILAPVEEVDTNQEAQDEIASSTGKTVEEPVEEKKPKGGLASAVAKVKTTKPVVKEKTTAQKVKDKGGVKRL